MILALPSGVTTTAPRARSAPTQAVTTLLRDYGPRVLALSLRLCNNRSDAEDLVQDVFLQAFRKWHTFKGDADPGTWLYTIAIRAGRARFRKRNRRETILRPTTELMPWTESSIAAVDSPPDNAARAEAAEAVHLAIAELPDQFRVPIILKEMLELPIEDVAQALNIKPETVKTRLHRARLHLRKAMLKELPARAAPAPTYEKRVCLDLLRAKLDAMDKGRGFPIGRDILCERCRAVFAELDMAQDACSLMADGSIPARLRANIESAIRRAEQPLTARGTSTASKAGKAGRTQPARSAASPRRQRRG